MSFALLLSLAAVWLSIAVAAVVTLSDRQAFLHRLFAAGVAAFGAEETLRCLAYAAVLPQDVVYWQKWILAASSLSPAIWLAFSLTYAQVNPRAVVSRWKWPLVAVAAGPLLFAGLFHDAMFGGAVAVADAQWTMPLGWAGTLSYCFGLAVSVLILLNLERTIRSSIGRVRWQIKFVVLGVAGLFVLRIYLASQALLYSRLDTGFGPLQAMALVVANLLFAVALIRDSSLKVDLYLSGPIIRRSLTVFFVGIYLITVGLLARFVRYSTLEDRLPAGAFLVFLALLGLAVLLLSNRLRRRLRIFVSRHFKRPIYDYRQVWMDLTSRTTSMVDVNELAMAVSRMVSESLDILSVSVWVVDDAHKRLTLAGSTAISRQRAKDLEKAGTHAGELIAFLLENRGCHDLTEYRFAWPRQIEQAGEALFREPLREFQMRYVVGLHAGGEFVGVMTLNDDRVGGEATLSPEETVLVETFARQLAASMLNLRLGERVRQAKEIEAFQTVSTFFVHDLKNVASRLSLTMQNLPANFENPEFRRDALGVISGSLVRIDDMCGRLSMLRKNVELNLGQCDLNELVSSTLDEFRSNLKATVEKDLKPLPKTVIDSEQIQKVLTNLIMNANEAVNGGGVIRVATIHDGNRVGFSVRDNGCGMSEEFIETSLFRPFRTTKKKGLGIGLFHSKQIVEAHHGTFEVSSAPGSGSEFRVTLPAAHS